MSVSNDNKVNSYLNEALNNLNNQISTKNSPKNSPYKRAYVKNSSPVQWEEFLPYKNELNNAKVSKNLRNLQLSPCKSLTSSKADKEFRNVATKSDSDANKIICTSSIFHIHSFHLHLIVSLTLLLFTQKCPQYLIIRYCS